MLAILIEQEFENFIISRKKPVMFVPSKSKHCYKSVRRYVKERLRKLSCYVYRRIVNKPDLMRFDT